MGDELADLLEVKSPSAVARADEALAKSVAAEELAGAKAAVVAVALGSGAKDAPPASVRDRVLASAGRPGRFGMFADRLARMFDLPVAEAESLCTKLENGEGWQPFLVEGVEMIPVTAGAKHANAVATLVRIQPGARFPEHAHHGDETMFVLDGGFREERDGGAEVWRGDDLHSTDGSGHTLLALPGRPCIAAAIVTGYADFK